MQNATNDTPDLHTLVMKAALPAGERPDPGTRVYLEKGTPGSDPGMSPLYASGCLLDDDDRLATQRSYALAS